MSFNVEVEGGNSVRLPTGGKYCPEDIIVTATGGGGATNCKIVDFTLAKSSGWIKLLTLDADVLAHINDASFTVVLSKTDGYVYEWYAGSMYIASNTPWGMAGTYPAYGFSGIEASETSSQPHAIYYPPNSTDTSSAIGGKGQFRVSGSDYYFKPGDGYIKAGQYRLTFMW